eukprot:Plantae.Rhodophyta-Hildenbrandia_rubra.ctg5314.p1 GENE.Plantae.Rhodophyta-Hildenbrandia_rubra.ctg5314~~Plantae.Rhodophyta-Hildenbrandia_rubra.ctg5314.p1  ORF type:complete len:415 (+),score=53.63 Plantae.Rhodophyta-Hildenbrandia_rubra.ctg5314:463-1707(+)
MKLDPSALRYLSDDEFRVLTGVEMGMKNHDLVPVPLITVISGLRHGGAIKCLREVHRHKLVHRESKKYEGYRLTYLGYDYLAMRALTKRSVIEAVGRGIGVGKEADVFIVTAGDAEPEIEGEEVAMKIHRLGRTSFRAVKNKRDYMVHRRAASWLYLSRLAATKEFAFMQALHSRNFSVPKPLGHSRHICVMELVDGVPLNHIRELGNPRPIAEELISFIVELAKVGLVHCDLNEFNVLISDDEKVTVIDFPQMVSTKHPDAEALYDRDMDGITKFFAYRFGVPAEELSEVSFKEACEQGTEGNRIDVELAASGFNKGGSGDSSSCEAQGLAIDLETLDLKCDKINSNKEAGNIDTSGIEEHAESIDQATIASKVRKYRANRAKRKQLSRRNITRDPEMRKIRHEMVRGETIWN